MDETTAKWMIGIVLVCIVILIMSGNHREPPE